MIVTPIYFDLSDQDQRSIVLKPLLPRGFSRKQRQASSLLLLNISLRDDFTGTQIANWFKSFPPEVIEDVNIEALLLKARKLENLRHKDFFFGSVLGKISSAAQEEIWKSSQSLSQVMSNTANLASDAKASTDSAPLIQASRRELGAGLISDIRNKTLGVCNTIEDILLLDPNITLQEAAEDEVAVAVEAEDAITLRQYLLNTLHIPDTPELPSGTVIFASSQGGGVKQRFRYGWIGGNPVVVESIQLATNSPGLIEESASTTSQLKRMVALLCHLKKINYHILPCVGYIQEPLQRFGVVFHLDRSYETSQAPVSLNDQYLTRVRVPLGSRIHTAYTLAVAVGNFHRVGWVHKELKSENVLFFKQSPPSNPHECIATSSPRALPDANLAQPFLFGFECSRPEDAETRRKADYAPKNNAYRHPERWGKPLNKFEKSHDVYALVRWIFF